MLRRLFASAFRRPAASAVALACALAVALAGCGGEAGGDGRPGAEAHLVLTRDFGAQDVAKEAGTPVTAGLTAMRQLQANAEADTSYGGKYVTAINGLKQDPGSGRDWLFYVDGQEAVKGASAWRIKPGEVVQWDYHRWQDVQTGGAIVGAFPRPLATRGVNLHCTPVSGDACRAARDALTTAGVRTRAGAADDAVRVVVGEWDAIAAQKSVPDLTKPAVGNGSFAAFTGRAGRRTLELAGDDGTVKRRIGAGAGLVAAFDQDGSVTWLITGTDQRGAENAARMLRTDALQNRFAVAASGKLRIGLPITGTGETP